MGSIGSWPNVFWRLKKPTQPFQRKGLIKERYFLKSFPLVKDLVWAFFVKRDAWPTLSKNIQARVPVLLLKRLGEPPNLLNFYFFKSLLIFGGDLEWVSFSSETLDLPTLKKTSKKRTGNPSTTLWRIKKKSMASLNQLKYIKTAKN